MSRRMIDPQTIIKSQIVDDKQIVYLNEILEKYGTITILGYKTITLQIYSKEASNELQNYISDDNDDLGNIVVNGSITITKNNSDTLYIQGMLHNYDGVYIPYLEIPSQNYNDGVLLFSDYPFDVHVIKV